MPYLTADLVVVHLGKFLLELRTKEKPLKYRKDDPHDGPGSVVLPRILMLLHICIVLSHISLLSVSSEFMETCCPGCVICVLLTDSYNWLRTVKVTIHIDT